MDLIDVDLQRGSRDEGDADVDLIDGTTKRQDDKEATEMKKIERKGLEKIVPRGKKKGQPYRSANFCLFILFIIIIIIFFIVIQM